MHEGLIFWSNDVKRQVIKNSKFTNIAGWGTVLYASHGQESHKQQQNFTTDNFTLSNVDL